MYPFHIAQGRTANAHVYMYRLVMEISVSDPDPLQETWIRIRVANFFVCLIHMSNKLINYKKKHRYEYYILYRKKLKLN